jgi:hypothetical protein
LIPILFPPPQLEFDFRHGGNRRVNHLPDGGKVCLPCFRGGRDHGLIPRQFFDVPTSERQRRESIRPTGGGGDKLLRRVEGGKHRDSQPSQYPAKLALHGHLSDYERQGMRARRQFIPEPSGFDPGAPFDQTGQFVTAGECDVERVQFRLQRGDTLDALAELINPTVGHGIHGVERLTSAW